MAMAAAQKQAGSIGYLARLLLGLLAVLIGLLALLAGGLWWWAGTDGSLATALRWADDYTPQLTKNLVVQNPKGSLRAGGRIDRITWQQEGLKVDAQGVDMAWQPWALVSGMLKLDRIAAANVLIETRSSDNKRVQPPQSLRLPVKVELDEFAVAQLNITGATAFVASGIAGNYRFDGREHTVQLSRANVASGNYSGRVRVVADAPFALNAAMAGTVTTAIPGSSQTLALSFDAAADGVLQAIGARASLQMKPADKAAVDRQLTPTSLQPQASATARITPFAMQPLMQASAVFENLNVGALWPAAPQTLLTGSASLAPLNSIAGTVNTGINAWALQLQTTNRLPGPWDKNRLPVNMLAASAEWRDGAVLIKTLDAGLAGGTLQASGQSTVSAGNTSTPASASLTATTSASTAIWSFQVSLKNINPKALHSQLAALPLAGQAQGSWDATLASGTLALSSLDLKTRDARLNGVVTIEPATRGFQGNLDLVAPGLQASVRGQLRKTSGNGELALRLKNASLALPWLQQVPGLPVMLQGAAAGGAGSLSASWQGGWQAGVNGAVLQARLVAPSISLRTAPSAPSGTTTLIELQAIDVTASGKLKQASITAQGRVVVGQRRYSLQAAADGGTTAGLDANAVWQGNLKELTLRMEDPALSAGTWQLATRAAVALKWQTGAFESGAGQAVLTAPAAGAPAVIAWQPVKWQAGRLATSGKVTGLPMAWLELITGPQTAGIGLAGNLVFDGAWDAVLGDTLTLKASLLRSSGDISLQPERSQPSGTQMAATRIAAGVRQALVKIDSVGNDVTLSLRWDTERAGTVDAQLKTRLAQSATGSWEWPQDAPLLGQIKAQLPRIGVWSALAPPGWRLRGSLGADVAVAGTRAAPLLAGNVQANDLALRSVVDGIEFGNGKLRATLDGNRMRINEFTLQGAGSTGTAIGTSTGNLLTAQGQAAWVNNQPQVLVEAKLDQLRISSRSDRQVTLSGNLQANLLGQLTQLTGNLRVDQARFVLPEEGAPRLGNDVVVRGAATAKLPETAATVKAPKASDPASDRQFKINVQLDLGQDLRVSGKGLDTQLRGTLALTGESLTQPRLVGTVTTFAGSYRAYSQQLDVERGVIRFNGPLDNPTLDILALRPTISRVDQRVGVQILGTALLPRVSLYAQPDLPEAEKLSWLVLGRASASGGSEAAVLQQAALALLGGKDGGMSGGLAASLGLDELSYRGASNNADGTTSQGAVTLGKRFSRNFYVAYERSISGALGTLLVFYDLSQRFTIRAQAGQQSAVDLIFTVPFD